MKDIYSRVPVDRVAARVVMFSGEHFEPKKKVLTDDQGTPHEIKIITRSMRMNPSFKDHTGSRFGRFTVLGLSKIRGGSWVVRCNCGVYSTRKARAITNCRNTQDRCDHCRHLAFLQRSEYHRRTGKEKDIREF